MVVTHVNLTSVMRLRAQFRAPRTPRRSCHRGNSVPSAVCDCGSSRDGVGSVLVCPGLSRHEVLRARRPAARTRVPSSSGWSLFLLVVLSALPGRPCGQDSAWLPFSVPFSVALSTQPGTGQRPHLLDPLRTTIVGTVHRVLVTQLVTFVHLSAARGGGGGCRCKHCPAAPSPHTVPRLLEVKALVPPHEPRCRPCTCLHIRPRSPVPEGLCTPTVSPNPVRGLPVRSTPGRAAGCRRLGSGGRGCSAREHSPREPLEPSLSPADGGGHGARRWGHSWGQKALREALGSGLLSLVAARGLLAAQLDRPVCRPDSPHPGPRPSHPQIGTARTPFPRGAPPLTTCTQYLPLRSVSQVGQKKTLFPGGHLSAPGSCQSFTC